MASGDGIGEGRWSLIAICTSVTHPTVAEFANWAEGEALTVLGVDILPGSLPLENTQLPERCVLVFGQEGPGLSPELQQHCAAVYSIAQFGSTRSINAGVASGIAMHAWVRQHGNVGS